MKHTSQLPNRAAEIQLPADLTSLFAEARRITADEQSALDHAAAALREAPDFVADVAKSLIVEDILRAMEASNLNRNSLAAKIGKSRQYVGKILDEDKRANFTIDTLAELATALGVSLHVRMLSANDQLKFVSHFTPRTETVVIEDFYTPRQMRNYDWTPQCFQPTNVIDLNKHRHEPTRLSS